MKNKFLLPGLLAAASGAYLLRPFFWPIDFVLARKTLWGIKWRVEQRKQELAERGSGVVYKYVGEDEPIAQ
jgi:hypothetical protein